MFKKFLPIFLCIALTSATFPALADGMSIPDPPKPVPGEIDVGAAISPMKKGQVAPFTGVLLSPKAVAAVIVELNSINDRIKIEVDKTKAEAKAQCDFKVAEIKTTTDADKKILQAQVDEKQKEITVAQDQLKKMEDSKPNVMLWTSLGFVGGVVMTVVTVYAVSQATK